MDSAQYVQWLKKEGLFSSVNQSYPTFVKVLKHCLNAKNEEVLLIGDAGIQTRRVSALMLGSYLLAAKRLGLRHKIIIQNMKAKGEKASPEVVESISRLNDGSIIVWALSGKPGSLGVLGTSFRKYSQMHKHRFVSTTGLGVMQSKGFADLVSSINVDYNEMRKRGKRLKEAIDMAKEVTITTDKGTNVTFDVKGKTAISNDALYKEPGFGGNIPAGEIYLAPRKKGVEGVVVIDGCSRTVDGTYLPKKPVKLRIQNGSVVAIEGGEEAKALEKSLQWAEGKAKYPWGVRRIGELGIGINPGARITNSTIISEKTLGTAHVAIGSNYWFGGTVYAINHLDQVFRNPQIYIDGNKFDVR